MSTAFNRFGCLALRYTYRIPLRRKQSTLPAPLRPRCLHTSPVHHDDDPKPRKPYVFDISTFGPDEQSYYSTLSPDQKAEFELVDKKLHEHMTSPEVESKLQASVAQAISQVAIEAPRAEVNIPAIKRGFMAMGEADEQNTGEDDKFKGDDITSIAHADLEQHREIREYARIAAWEMPLLSKLAKPFTPPPLDHPLRFRYTTYMGETHPAAKKIVLEFCTRDLPDLTEAQRIKLIKLTGPRYNPETDIVKMSCEMFETQAQNKRYLGDLVETLMAEAQDSTDMFEDVPLDFRHHKYKPKLLFPEAWKLTAERKQQLEVDRQQKMLTEREKEEKGEIVDGVRAIEAGLKARPVVIPNRVLDEAKPLKLKGKGAKARKAMAR